MCVEGIWPGTEAAGVGTIVTVAKKRQGVDNPLRAICPSCVFLQTGAGSAAVLNVKWPPYPEISQIICFEKQLDFTSCLNQDTTSQVVL